MDKQLFDHYEYTDYDKLITFNEKTGLFKEIAPTERLTYYDASACTITDMGARIELKSRDASTFQYPTLFMEDTKLNIVLDYLFYGDSPLYVNFMADGNTVIFNLSKLNIRPKYEERRTYSPSYKCWEYQGKNGLYLSDAFIYDSNGNLIQKPHKSQ